MLHLRNRLLPLLRAASHPTSSPPSSYFHRALLLFSTSTSSAPFSLDAYLVTACGLTPAEALKASSKAFKEASKLYKKSRELSESCLSSASNPDAVLAFLSQVVGLSRPDIAAVVAANPLLLCASVADISPQILALRNRLSLSTPQIARFLLVGSRTLGSSNMLPNLEFFIPFYGSFDRLLVIVRKSFKVLCYDLEKVIKPNIALLNQCGLSDRDIVQMSSNTTWLLTFSPERVKGFLQRADELGVPRSSGMFKRAVVTVAWINQERVAAKLEFYKKTLGCSEGVLAVAVRKQPDILTRSEENVRRKCEFLIKEVGLQPDYIAERPMLLMHSLEKRLAPRFHVMKVLQAKGFIKNCAFVSIANRTEKVFKSKFIDCHKDSVPELGDAYAAACAGKVPSQVQFGFRRF